jgi:C-terminal processing protease CtpA/Prc
MMVYNYNLEKIIVGKKPKEYRRFQVLWVKKTTGGYAVKKIKYYSIALLTSLFIFSSANSQKMSDCFFEMTAKDWLEDFNCFYEVMKKNYPYLRLKKRMHGYNWLDLKKYFQGRILSAKTTIEFLEIFYDAVEALQNGHTRVFEPEWLDYYYRDSKTNFYRYEEPYCSIFTEELKKRYEYWRPFFETYIDQRYHINYDALILYHKGSYSIYDGHGEWKEKYGEKSEIIAVNNQSIDEAVKKCFEKGYLDWDFKRKKSFIWKISPRHFGADANFVIRTASGKKKKVTFKSGLEYKYKNPFRTPAGRISTNIWKDKKIAYIRINDFLSDHMDKDHKQLIDFYKKVKDYKYLIIDVRWNWGGSYKPWMKNVIAPLAKTELISKMNLAYKSGQYVNLFRKKAGIKKIVPKDYFNNLPSEVLSKDFTIYDYTQKVKPSREVNFKGEIILLIDKNTYSATDAFVLFCKETNFATLYGVPTGGDGISESPAFYVLPNSKIIIRFTPAMGIDYTGNANEEVRVQPDVYYESEFGNNDELIEYVIKGTASPPYRRRS